MQDHRPEPILRFMRIGYAIGVVALASMCLWLAYMGAWEAALAFGFIGAMIALPPKYDPAVRLKERFERR
jgi:hypothetical protein